MFGSKLHGEAMTCDVEETEECTHLQYTVRLAQELIGFRHDGASSAAFEVLRVSSGNKPKWKFRQWLSIERLLKGTSVDDISLIANALDTLVAYAA